MRRHHALQDLSRDHHVLLLHARRLRGEDPRVGPAEARRRYLLFHGSVGRLHCQEEEAAVAPFLAPALRERLLREHADLEERAARLPGADEAFQRDLGERLRSHVRFEEDEAFAALQRDLSPGQWEELAARAHGYRSRVRPGSIGPGAAEECFL